MPIDYVSGTPVNSRAAAQANANSEGFSLFNGFNNPAPPPPPPSGNFVEHFRRGADGKAEDTQYQIVSREEAYSSSESSQGSDNFYYGGSNNGYGAGRSYYPNQGWSQQPPPPPPPPQQPVARGLFQPWPFPFGAQQQAPRQDYYWGGRYN
jgi:hypothetical protein